MVPTDFTGFFSAATAAAGALIGLLFVAVSLRPDSIFAADAGPRGRAIAGAAFTSLVNAFFVSLVALLPGTNLGVIAVVMALLSIWGTLRFGRGRGRDGALLQVLSTGAFLTQGVIGAILQGHAHDRGLVGGLAGLIVAAFGVGLARAWTLLEGRHVPRPRTEEATVLPEAGAGAAAPEKG